MPQRMKAVCLRAMSLRPEDRYPSADELAGDLEPLVHRQPRRRLAIALAASLFALALGIAVWAGNRVFSPDASPRAGVRRPPQLPSLSATPCSRYWLQRPKKGYIDITDATPLRNGDKLQVRIANSAGWFIPLFLINEQGQLRKLLVPSSRSQDQEFTYPPPREEREKRCR